MKGLIGTLIVGGVIVCAMARMFAYKLGSDMAHIRNLCGG